MSACAENDHPGLARLFDVSTPSPIAMGEGWGEGTRGAVEMLLTIVSRSERGI